MNIKISIVSFNNTLPFRFGLNNFKFAKEFNVIIEEDVPSICAKKLIEGRVDIGLIPVAKIDDVPNRDIITNYCIGTRVAVESVLLLSNKPLHLVKSVMLDHDSETSNRLIQLLSKYHWKNNITFSKNNTNKYDGRLMIGDKALSSRPNYEYITDLGKEWHNFTKLPFVFACWVTNKDLPKDFIIQFSESLSYGLRNIEKVTKNDIVLYKYLTENIDFKFDSEKQKALQLYHQYLKKMQAE